MHTAVRWCRVIELSETETKVCRPCWKCIRQYHGRAYCNLQHLILHKCYLNWLFWIFSEYCTLFSTIQGTCQQQSLKRCICALKNHLKTLHCWGQSGCQWSSSYYKEAIYPLPHLNCWILLILHRTTQNKHCECKTQLTWKLFKLDFPHSFKRYKENVMY